ncbi:MAG: flagellar basal-body MS-ring/collar protein FliF [Sphingomonadaceae bacterium]
MATDTLTAPPRTSLLPSAVSERLAALRANPLAKRAFWPTTLAVATALALLAWAAFVPPDRTPLYSSLADGDKAAVVATLEKAGMQVKLDSRTGAVLLPPEDHARARMLLAADGLPRAAPDGYDLLSDMPLGTSRAIEGARLKGAQERELARSIESLQGVEAARVLIARPDATPFVRDKAPVTASVTVTLAPGRTLSDSQARAIVYLVAGAVPGLSTDHVAIADQTGRLIAGEPGNHLEDAANRRLAMQARMEARTRDAILTLLGPIVGPENVSAQVAIDLDFTATEAASEKFDPEGALRSEAVDRRNASEPRAIGIPGATTNTVPAATAVTAEAPPPAEPTTTDNSEESATRNYELSRAVEVSSRSGGQVRRLTAAVAIDAAALGPAQDHARLLQEMQALVEGAVGYDAARGDKIAVAARSFVAPADTTLPIWKEPVVVESSKWLAAALVAIAILAFLVRPMMKNLRKENTAPLLASPDTRETPALLDATVDEAPLPVDYADKLQQARLIASTDAARATAVARRLLSAPEPQPAQQES